MKEQRLYHFYKIILTNEECVVNGRNVYVGSTRKRNPRDRFSNHIVEMKRGGHGNKYLQGYYNNIVNKCLNIKDHIKFEIRSGAVCTEEEARGFEAHYISTIDAKNICNIFFDGGSCANRIGKKSPRFGKPRPIGAGRRPKAVHQIDKSTMIILKTYISITEAARQTNAHYPDISRCCNGKQKSAGGYLWRFASIVA
jgi:hypothetical protein